MCAPPELKNPHDPCCRLNERLSKRVDAEIDGEFVYFLNDALSTVRDLVSYNSVSSEWEVLRSYEFDEYGNALPGSGSGTGPSSPKTFVGGLSVNDDRADSGMFNMGHRNYAAGVLGRFISRDPIGHRGGLNLYEAMKSNPVRFTDHTGLGPDDPWWVPPFLREGKSSKCGPLNFKSWSQKDTKGWMKEIFDPGFHDTTDRLMETGEFPRDDVFNRAEIYEQRTQSGGGKPPGKIPHQSMGRFSLNIVFFGPLKFLNFLNNVNDARSIYQTLCDGPGGPLEIPTIYRDGSQMSQEEYTNSRANDRMYFLGWNVFQTRTVGPYDSI